MTNLFTARRSANAPARILKPKKWRRGLGLVLALLLGTAGGAWAQLTGNKTVGGTTPDYATIKAAIADLNTKGVGTNGVTFNIAAGYSETFTAVSNGTITAAVVGTVANPIVFQKTGTGANPKITLSAAGSGSADAIITLTGTDYVTFDGIDLAAPGGGIEYGYKLVNTGANGCQHNQIKNCIITLEKSNTASAGIYFSNSSTSTVAAAGNSNNQVYGNAISNTYLGVYLAGLAVSSSTTSMDVGNQIGLLLNGAKIGNSISNIGGSTVDVYGIRAEAQKDLKVEYNIIDIATGSTGRNEGILSSQGGGTFGALTINENNITISTASTAEIYGIYQGNVNPTSVKITNNILQNWVLTGAASAVSFIRDVADNTGLTGETITGNVIGGLGKSNTIPTTATTYGIYRVGGNYAAANALVEISGNKISYNNYTGTGDANQQIHGIVDGTGGISGQTVIVKLENNEITNNLVATTGSFYGINRAVTQSASVTVNGNTVQNNTFSGAGVKVTSLNVEGQVVAGATVTASSNLIDANKLTGGGSLFTGISLSRGIITASSNTITGNSIAPAGASAALYGYYNASVTAPASETLTGNTITGNSIGGTTAATGTALYGLYASAATTTKTIAQNTIANLTIGAAGGVVSGEVQGIYAVNATAGKTTTSTRNKLYGLAAYGTAGRATGLNLGAATLTASNNLVGSLAAPESTDPNAVVGLNLASATTASIYYNTILLTASGGNSFGSSGLCISATAGAFDLRNNLVDNQSVAGTTSGNTLALRLATAGTQNTAPTLLASSTNNNLYYVPTAAANYVYGEGTAPITTSAGNGQATLSAYKSFVGPTREAASVTEDAPFVSTTGADATFLHIRPNVMTLVESRGTSVAVANDYDNEARGAYDGTVVPHTVNNVAQNKGGGVAPDIGADEGDFTPFVDFELLALAAPSGTICYTTATTVSVQVRNNGINQAFSAGVPLLLAVSVTQPNGSVVILNSTVTSGSLAAGATATYVVSTTFDMTDGGTYSFAPSLSFTGDQVSSNNALVVPVAVNSSNPSVAVVAAPTAVCSGGSFVLTASNTPYGATTGAFTTTITGPGTVSSVTYSGTVGGVSNAQAQATVTGAPVGANVYTITTTDPNGCARTVTRSVTVSPLPTASLSSSGPVCSGNQATVSIALGGSAGPWTFSYTLNGGAVQTVASTSTNPYVVNLPNPLNSNQTFGLTALSDAGTGCPAASLPASVLVAVNTSTVWTGAATGDATNWFNSGNWTNCVPTRYTDALVPGSLGSYPALNGTTPPTAEVRTLTLANGASLSQSTGTLDIYGSLLSSTPSANVSLTNGTVGFRGIAPTVSGPLTFYNLAVNLSAPSGLLTFGTDATVMQALTLTQGLATTGVTTLTLSPSATIAETDASYVLGRVATTRTLAPGTAEDFGNLGLRLMPATGSVAPGSTPVLRVTGGVLSGVGTTTSMLRYFDIQPATNTGLNVDMVFTYFEHERNSIAAANAKLFKSVSSLSGPWQPQSNTSQAANGAAASYSVTKTGLTDFSIWTMGDAIAPLPVGLTAFEVQRQGAHAALTWRTAQEVNNAGFMVQVSTDGTTYRQLGFVQPASASSSTARSYSFLDHEAGKAGLRYYRLRQVDLDGTAAFSPVRPVDFGQATALSAVPNPFGESLTLTLHATTATNAPLTLTDMLGRVVLRQALALPAGTSQLELPTLAGLPVGVYVLQLSLDGQVQTLKLVKQ
ncbi:MAG: T9SS type A sorting domain-containing protein [Janthinobacterium lividum]